MPECPMVCASVLATVGRLKEELTFAMTTEKPS